MNQDFIKKDNSNTNNNNNNNHNNDNNNNKERFLKLKATSCGLISSVFSTKVLLCVSSVTSNGK